ncbi:MAG: hypothetical protein U5Q44_09510 [Dehalococcoidia bacterium]|nr:hypothetical protein [Dehalococcoidia bacterium]
MAGESTPSRSAFVRSAPQTFKVIGPDHVRQWAELGRRLYKGNWKSSALAAQFYDLSPQIFQVLRLSQASRLVMFVDELSRHSYELASACLASAPEVLSRLDNDDRLPFITYAAELAQSSWADSRLYFERGVSLVHKVHAPERERFLVLAAQVARNHQRSAFQYLEEATTALAQLDVDDHHQVIELGERLSAYSPYAAMDFISNVPQVLEVIRLDDLEPWHDTGLQILKQSRDGGEAYFRLQSTRGEGVLENLSARVELTKVGEVLRMYCKALTGRNVSVHATADLADKGIGWTDEQRASTEGTTIYLPELMEKFPEKDRNFEAFKVFATHQAGRLEFGSFDFHYDEPAVLFETQRPENAPKNPGSTDMERFFDLFSNRKLASDIFTIAEDSRIDAAVKQEYGGIRRALMDMQEEELTRRSPVRGMPLRDGFVENLVRYSLGGPHFVEWPSNRSEPLEKALGIMDLAVRRDATVQDAAEATLRLYSIAMAIPNVMEEDLDAEWGSVEPSEGGSEAMPMEGGGEMGEGGQPQMGDVGEGAEGEEDYSSPEPVDFRGDFKPELVQLLMKMREDAELGGDAGEMSPGELSPEQLQEMLEKSAEIDLDSLMEGDLDATTGMFMSNLQKEAGTPSQEKDEDGQGNPSNDNSTGTGGRRGAAAAHRHGLLLRRVGLPGAGLQAALVCGEGIEARCGRRELLRQHHPRARRAGGADPEAVRADEAGDVPED